MLDLTAENAHRRSSPRRSVASFEPVSLPQVSYTFHVRPAGFEHVPNAGALELEAWVPDEDCWPKKRDLKTFKEWFAPDVLEIVFDLADDALEALEIEE